MSCHRPVVALEVLVDLAWWLRPLTPFELLVLTLLVDLACNLLFDRCSFADSLLGLLDELEAKI